MGKVIIFSAPSGSGKSTLIHYVLNKDLGLEFSVSATSRNPRGEERHAKDYYFFTAEEFRERIESGDFLEWEEVYSGHFYGTLKSEVERIWTEGKTVLFDVDVVGGLNIKKIFGDQALAIFVQAPSIESLSERLLKRGTDSREKIEQRLAKAEYEMSFADRFDEVVVNDDLKKAYEETERIIRCFLEKA